MNYTYTIAFLLFSMLSYAQVSGDFEGDIKSTSLAGSGDRPVVADQDGVLKIGPTISPLPSSATTGEMAYFDGTNWQVIPTGTQGQTLTFCNGLPTWGACQNVTISSHGAEQITNTSAKIRWMTSENVQGYVEYGTTTNYGQQTSGESSFNFAEHLQPLTGLQAGTTYYYRVHSTTQFGVMVSATGSFITTGSSGNSGVIDFGSAQQFDSSLRGATSVQIVDINNDGLNDIAVFEGGKHNSGVKNFAWYRAPNWDKFDFNSTKPGAFLGHSGFVDIDQDGLMDFVLPEDQHSGSDTNAKVYWYKNPGNGSTGTWTRTVMASYNDVQHFGGLVITDMDNDGKDDVVLRNTKVSAEIHIIFQNSPTSWVDRTFSVRPREGLSVSDIDNDGINDIMMNGFWWKGPNNWRTQNYTEHTIDNAYFSQTVQALNNSTKQGHGDLNGDGREDVVIANAEGQAGDFAWYEAPANPTTQAWTKHTLESGSGFHQMQIYDMDNDGDLDIMSGVAAFNGIPNTKEIFIYQNNGSGVFTRHSITTLHGSYYGVVGDLGGDGDLDIVAPNFYSRSERVYIYENLLN